MSIKNYEAGDKQNDLHQAKTKGAENQANAKGCVKNEGISVSQLEDKQNKEITVKEAEVKKDQERDELKITIEKAEVMKDHEQVKLDDIKAQNQEVIQQEDKQTKEITIDKAEKMEDQERVEQVDK